MDRAMTGEDRAAMRAFLQRSEVRLSSIHRAATALLSGAGVLVLLPALGREALMTAARGLLAADRTLANVLLLTGIVGVIAAIVIVVWLLLVELTRFYFHSTRLTATGWSAVSPHLGIPSLRLPDDELSPSGADLLAAGRADEDSLALLVPPDGRARLRIDRQVAAHAGPGSTSDDLARAMALLTLVGARDHSLTLEVARTEYVMARHTQRLQIIILRYMKALLVVVASLLVVLALAAVLAPPSPVGPDVERWSVILLLTWSPVAMVAVTSPIRWLGALLRSKGATRTGIRYDPEMTRLERVIAVVTSVVALLAVTAGIDVILRAGEAGGTGRTGAFAGALAAGLVAHVGVLLAGRRSGSA